MIVYCLLFIILLCVFFVKIVYGLNVFIFIVVNGGLGVILLEGKLVIFCNLNFLWSFLYVIYLWINEDILCFVLII